MLILDNITSIHLFYIVTKYSDNWENII